MIPLLKRLATFCQGASLLFPATVGLGLLSAFVNGSVNLAKPRWVWCLGLAISFMPSWGTSTTRSCDSGKAVGAGPFTS